ncbi:acetylxylan esterase [Fodinicola feengrottensis]|uniref:Acetyl xylan esterase domain-containing protein n=1 Tax=Fodinicola feengrottensis TaxID=435914 RepID=A0ABP4UIG6_9ACTN|nr:acetylxylan esterase [Fodinicola feengrottensis]
MTITDADFTAYWEKIDIELTDLPARPVIERIPGRCTDDFTGYEVRLTSLGAYRIFGYLSIPTGDGPFPALLATPRYGSVNNPPHYNDRLRYVTLTIAHRGQRTADSPYAAAYPGLLTDRIADDSRYVYRGIVADCLRAAEFLSGLPEVDQSRIAVVGDDLAVLTAARRPVFAALQVTGALLYRAAELRKATADYPMEEFNDHLRTTPADTDAVSRTLEFFDSDRHAAAVRASVRVDISSETSALLPLAGKLDAERYVVSHEGQTDNDAADAWLAGKFGLPALSRFDRTSA